MRSAWSRTLLALALTVASVSLIWGGHALNETGRLVGSEEFRFAVGYYLGAHLLWMLAGGIGAGIISLDTRPGPDRSATPLLVSAILPIVILLPVYVWSSPGSPSWLLEVTPRSDWLISPFVTAATAVFAGVLLGAGLLRISRSSSEPVEQDRSG